MNNAEISKLLFELIFHLRKHLKSFCLLYDLLVNVQPLAICIMASHFTEINVVIECYKRFDVWKTASQ